MSVEVPSLDTASIGRVIAEGLNAQEFTVHDPAAEDACFMRVMNARAAFSQVLISQAGRVTWDYLPFPGREADPAQVAGMIVGLLDDETAVVPAVPGGPLGQSLKDSVDSALRGSGMRVTRCAPLRDEFGELCADMTITNPDQPARGEVTLTDEGMIIWECRLASAGSAGVSAQEISAIVGRVLSRVQSPEGASAAPAGSRRRIRRP
ncbi:MAG TPA: hypothetical protein VGG25_16790 [Streptosporangiaceae bacterium]|jgi:hypothetical protein